MNETSNAKQDLSVETTSTDYIAPQIESVVTRESLEREVAYAGFTSQQFPG